MSDQDKGLYNKYQIINRETARNPKGIISCSSLLLNPAARAALMAYAKATGNQQLAMEITAWLSSLPELLTCDWCGDKATELSHPHMFDMALVKRMCRGCWEHDCEVNKGS
ncbi:hypothetical protein H1230_20585 [Paenibacillus sp. 19GGS1-52]|uniref:hypothetical protein n=1 Tax=Paenibacillus sp. 19GGS1-52 TaxID=2758563 RepID=UPI001EFB1E3F|nr:hypothetical protein [Paenibacillus sp. 19GGS1-52]ULO05468.1 hypothetical protein H1230_20585 [Paenibacillus sp. 19GGS1-52]